MNKENQRIKITKHLLKEALFELLESKSIQKISITELCKKAGINRATFYRHYTVPRDILIEIEEKILAETRQLCPMPATQAELEKYIYKLCKYINNEANTIKILIKHNSEFNITYIFGNLYDLLKSVKRITLNNNVLDDESIDLISAYCVGGGYQLLKKWLMEDIDKTYEEISKIICSLINTNVSWIL